MSLKQTTASPPPRVNRPTILEPLACTDGRANRAMLILTGVPLSCYRAKYGVGCNKPENV
jgi:hypothetical protein